MSNENSIHQEPQEKSNQPNINQLRIPVHISHLKPGNTLCSNGNALLFQDGSTAIELRMPPKFPPKRIPWRYGLVRDILWCSDLGLFIFLTKDCLHRFNPESFFTAEAATINKPIVNITINKYNKVKPYDEINSFWRCTCAGKTLYISYSGYGTVIDEYTLERSSCKLVNRWTPPTTCSIYEGIWCIRYQSNTDQLGLTIMDARTNQWRIEVRSRQNLATTWQMVLPLTHGDCELSSLPNGDWLAVNSCGIRLLQIADEKLKGAVEYERELRNAISIGNLYFVIRTKNTVEIHKIENQK